MAGVSAERQETGVVNSINNAVKKNKKNPITVCAGKTHLNGVISAKKYGGRQLTGSEPYTDVQFFFVNKKSINLSLKGESAASLAGGGLRGLNLAIPGLADRFMKAAYNYLIGIGLNVGDKVPDIYGKIESKIKEKIVIGNASMGGPIDYMYIGPMTVVAKYDDKKNQLHLNGALIKALEYAKTHELYFRLRARREDQRFDPAAKNGNIPKIYGKSPSRGDSAGRIVVTDSVPRNAIIIKI